MDMSRGGTVLSSDERPIMAILWPDNDESHFRVGQSGVTKIVAYDESGHMAYVPWLAVFKGDEIVLRCPADQVAISYQP